MISEEGFSGHRTAEDLGTFLDHSHGTPTELAKTLCTAMLTIFLIAET
jgi:hypothetical protein